MKLGPIDLPTDLILAPLMDVTTPSFRQLIIDQGYCGMIVTPMIFVQQIVKAPKTILPHMESIEKQRPSSVQIVSSGKNQDHVKVALDILNSYKFDVLDINAGCPAPHTMRSGGGGAFLREYHQETNLDRLENLISWTTKYSDVPVSLKTRLGFLESTDILKFGKSLENLGIQFLTIHGRTIKQKYRGAVDLEKIRAVVKLLEIPVVGNGDVRSYEDYIHMKEITGVDAVMIGRAAMSDPFIFRKISETKQAIDQGLPKPEYPDKMTLTQIRTLLQKNDEFITESSRFWNTLRFRRAEMRRLAIWFIKGIPGYKLVRQKLSHMEDLVELKHYIFGTQIEQDFQSQHVKIVEKSNPTIEIR